MTVQTVSADSRWILLSQIISSIS